jgi:hypothetical protein
MCKHRIFSRIKSNRPDATYTKRGKVFLGTILRKVLDDIHRHRNGTELRSNVETFIKDGQNLLGSLEKLENCREENVLEHMEEVLYATYRLNKTPNLDGIVDDLSPTTLKPTLRESFIARLAKLAQYRECALYLLRMAKDSELFRKTEITLVSLEQELFTSNLTASPDCCLEDCLFRCDNDASSAYSVEDITSRLQGLKLETSSFLSTVRNILRDSRVHAEVQIVCHYELHPAAKMPRVICSSKDACYLCNLFVQLHGKFHIPRTHGNVYTSWLLPPISNLTNVQARLNKALEAEIRGIIGDLMRTEISRLKLIRNDNESTVFPFSTFPPTPASSVTLAGASGNGGQATGAHGIYGAQQRLQDIGEVFTRGLPIETPPRTPITGTFGLASPDLDNPTTTPPGADEGLPIMPQASVPNSPIISQARVVDTATFHEVTKKESDELATASPEHPELVNQDITPEQREQSKAESDQQPKPVAEHKPTPEANREPERKLDTAPTPIPRASPFPKPLQPQIHHHHHLARDQPITLALTTTLLSFTAGPITIHPDLIRTQATQPTTTTTPLITEANIHWLPRRRAAAFYLARPKGFVDLELCEAGVDVERESAAGCVYMAYRGEVVVVDFGRGVTPS